LTQERLAADVKHDAPQYCCVLQLQLITLLLLLLLLLTEHPSC
jgi:hypothetical protein